MIANNIAHYPSIPTINITTPPISSIEMSNIITPSKVSSISIHDTTSFNREITQSNNPISKLSKQSSTTPVTQFSLQYNIEKMESTPSTGTNQTKLLEPKVPSDNFSNCYELFRFSLNTAVSGNNPLACKYTQPLNSLTTCYSTSTSNIQHAIPNDLITLATMEPETFKSNHSKLASLRIHDMHTPVRYTPNHSPHLNAYHQHADSTLISSSPLSIRSKIVGIVSTPTSRSNSTDLRKSPCITSENSSCRSPSRDDTPKPSLSKIQKPKHQHGKKKSSSSSSTDEEDGKKFNTGTWTRLEHEQFLNGLEDVGKNWKLISENYVQTRKRTQIASHAQKWFLKLAEMKKGGVDSSPDELYL